MPDLPVTIGPGGISVSEFNSRVANVPKLMKQIGQLLVNESRRAFQDEAFCGVPWPAKYPGSPTPFISVAGVVQDFMEGRSKPRSETLHDRPALLRTGELSKSPAWRSTGAQEGELGSVLPYAAIQHKGGISEQPISDDAKERIEKWLTTKSGGMTKKDVFAPEGVDEAEFTKWAEAKGYEYKRKKKDSPQSHRKPRKVTVKSPYAARLAFLLKPNFRTLTTQVNARPFIGISAETADKIAMLVAGEIAD